MAIEKLATYGKTENVFVVETGTGDIHMISSKKTQSGSVHLLFKEDEPMPINKAWQTNDKTADDVKPDLVFIFNKVESIDAVINMLIDCKEEILKEY